MNAIAFQAAQMALLAMSIRAVFESQREDDPSIDAVTVEFDGDLASFTLMSNGVPVGGGTL